MPSKSALLTLLGLGAIVLGGCSLPTTAIAQVDPESRYLLNAQILVGRNILHDEPWELEPLDAQTLASILSRRMPASSEIMDARTEADIIKSVTGLELRWIPRLTAEEKALEETPYHDLESKSFTVKKYLRGLLTNTSEGGYHTHPTPGDVYDIPFNAILFTRKFILVMEIPGQ